MELSMHSLPDIIERLQNATRPERELDSAIAVALRIPPGGEDDTHWLVRNFPEWRGLNGRVICVHTDGSDGPSWKAQTYTASVDAALLLAPAGVMWSIFKEAADGDINAFCYSAWCGFYAAGARHRCAAIALCLAALRLRKERENG
jgi:hypothetical protein